MNIWGLLLTKILVFKKMMWWLGDCGLDHCVSIKSHFDVDSCNRLLSLVLYNDEIWSIIEFSVETDLIEINRLVFVSQNQNYCRCRNHEHFGMVRQLVIYCGFDNKCDCHSAWNRSNWVSKFDIFWLHNIPQNTHVITLL